MTRDGAEARARAWPLQIQLLSCDASLEQALQKHIDALRTLRNDESGI